MVEAAIYVYFGFLIVLSFYSLFAHRGKNLIIGGRQVGVIGTTASAIAGLVSGGGVITVIGLSLLPNFTYFWLIGGFVAGILCIAWLAPKIRQQAAENNYVNISDLFLHRAGVFSVLLAAVTLLLLATMMAAAQFFAVGSMFAQLTNLPFAWSVSIIGFAIGLYLVLGGYKMLIYSDIIQMFVTLCMATAIYVVFFHTLELSFMNTVDFRSETNVLLSLGIFTYALILILGRPDIWQRVFSARSERVARTSFLVFPLIYVPYLIAFLCFAAYLLHVLPNVDMKNFLTILFSDDLQAGNLFIAFMGVGILAAAMSTIDSQIYIASTTFLKNIMGIDNEIDYNKFVLFNRLGITLITMLGVAASFFVEDVIRYLINTSGLVSIFAPALLYCLYKKSGTSKQADIAVTLSLVAGIAVFFYLFFTDGFTNFWWNCMPALVSTLCLVAAHYVGATFCKRITPRVSEGQ